ncbi:MAG: hypothetical protein AAFY56_02095, partial [Pseudomonadota bacterium]
QSQDDQIFLGMISTAPSSPPGYFEFDFAGYSANVAEGAVGYYHEGGNTRIVGQLDGKLFEIVLCQETLTITEDDFSFGVSA